MFKDVKFLATTAQPSYKEVSHWIDLLEDPTGGTIKVWNGAGWKKISGEGDSDTGLVIGDTTGTAYDGGKGKELEYIVDMIRENLGGAVLFEFNTLDLKNKTNSFLSSFLNVLSDSLNTFRDTIILQYRHVYDLNTNTALSVDKWISSVVTVATANVDQQSKTAEFILYSNIYYSKANDRDQFINITASFNLADEQNIQAEFQVEEVPIDLANGKYNLIDFKRIEDYDYLISTLDAIDYSLPAFMQVGDIGGAAVTMIPCSILNTATDSAISLFYSGNLVNVTVSRIERKATLNTFQVPIADSNDDLLALNSTTLEFEKLDLFQPIDLDLGEIYTVTDDNEFHKSNSYFDMNKMSSICENPINICSVLEHDNNTYKLVVQSLHTVQPERETTLDFYANIPYDSLDNFTARYIQLQFRWEKPYEDSEERWVLYYKLLRDPELQSKQDTLVSGTNIKTVNNQSLLGNGNIDIVAGDSKVYVFDLSKYIGETSPSQRFTGTIEDDDFNALQDALTNGKLILGEITDRGSIPGYIPLQVFGVDGEIYLKGEHALGPICLGINGDTKTYQGYFYSETIESNDSSIVTVTPLPDELIYIQSGTSTLTNINIDTLYNFRLRITTKDQSVALKIGQLKGLIGSTISEGNITLEANSSYEIDVEYGVAVVAKINIVKRLE